MFPARHVVFGKSLVVEEVLLEEKLDNFVWNCFKSRCELCSQRLYRVITSLEDLQSVRVDLIHVCYDTTHHEGPRDLPSRLFPRTNAFRLRVPACEQELQ